MCMSLLLVSMLHCAVSILQDVGSCGGEDIVTDQAACEDEDALRDLGATALFPRIFF